MEKTKNRQNDGWKNVKKNKEIEKRYRKFLNVF